MSHPPAYGSGGAPPAYQDVPGKVPAGYPQGPPAGGAYAPPGGAYQPAGGAYQPAGGAYQPAGGTYQPTGPMPGYQGYNVIVQPQANQVVIVGGCPSCRVGVLEDDFTCLGVCCAILFFPIGILCCLAMKQRRCPNCGAVFS